MTDPSPTPAAPRRPRSAVLALLALALLAAASWLAHGIALERGLLRLHEAAQARIGVEAARLDVQLARVEVLPRLLETSPEVQRLLEQPSDSSARAAASAYLKGLNAIAGADNLYVLRVDGLAIAAADDGQPGTPVGQDLSYRPYVRDALARGRGAFYGVGITSARAGYYLSYALPASGPPRGVATVKLNLEALEAEWAGLPGGLLLADEHRVAILASCRDWRYRPLAPLTDAARGEASTARRYADAALEPLDWRMGDAVAPGARRARIDGKPFLVSEQPVNQGRWTLLEVDDEAPARAGARTAAAITALIGAVLLLASAVAWLRRRALHQKLANRAALQAAHDSLEVKVRERTAELEAAQADLLHASRLALLGQMSAGIVHELNQPLAALNTLADNTGLLIERGRLDDAKANLGRIGRIVARLATLTRQLKVFAHRPAVGNVEGPASEGSTTTPRAGADAAAVQAVVNNVVNEALALVAERVRAQGTTVDVDIDPPDLRVAADAARLEQVFVNLFGNALDAMEGAAVREPRIRVCARAEGDTHADIDVANSGPPIDPAIHERLFQPFVSSKPAGKGLGLGLMISAHLVEGFGGRIEARNVGSNATFACVPPEGQSGPEGGRAALPSASRAADRANAEAGAIPHGVVFTVRLPRVRSEAAAVVQERRSIDEALVAASPEDSR